MASANGNDAAWKRAMRDRATLRSPNGSSVRLCSRITEIWSEGAALCTNAFAIVCIACVPAAGTIVERVRVDSGR